MGGWITLTTFAQLRLPTWKGPSLTAVNIHQPSQSVAGGAVIHQQRAIPVVDMDGEKKETNGYPMALSQTNGKTPEEEPLEKIPYPKSVFFIIGNEFCERFSYYGMRTILVLYLNEHLRYSENESTIIYHVFVMLCYFTPVIGGIMADSWLGKFKTILYVSLIYAFGNIVLSSSSIDSLGNNNTHVWLALTGLFLIGAGTGGIKPCVSSFGGDQFVVPQQEKQLQQFFSVFYFSINAGSVISCFLTPMLRANVSCFGDDKCYPLAFGVPAVLMCLSVVIFVCGSAGYKMKKPQGNIVLEVVKCTGHAILKKVQTSKIHKRDHWLDYADDLYPKKLIEDTKIFMRLMLLFAPTIVFWALYEQQGSRWTFQANRMDGNVFGFVVQPDQMQTVNPVLCLLFIPLFEGIIYPVLAKLHIVRTPLQKLSWGGILAALSYVVAGLLQLKIEQADPVLPTGSSSQLRLYNTFNCPFGLELPDLNLTHTIQPLGTYEFLDLPGGTTTLLTATASNCSSPYTASGTVSFAKGDISSYLLAVNGNQLNIDMLNITGKKEVEKSESAQAKVKVIYGGTDSFDVKLSGKSSHTFNVVAHQSSQYEMDNNKWYSVEINGKKIGDRVYLYPGGVYTLLITDDKQNYELLTITTPNNLNLMWQIPQYIIITAAEIMFSITGLEFSFTQAPVSMKSVISSFWLLTDSFGNVIVLIVAGSHIVENQAYEMFLFAGLMGVVMVIFIIVAMNYKYSDIKDDGSEDENAEVSRI
ncbi:oligopeptide transporter [Nesidiocoris tenuis]|uniref:Oligopeptide transporter n=1 Tax=Nesidiocoris tenuis TaxID=355587 RepID=A0ABN7B4M3_9HEMI|nr:oligopeptide transporter [Nesidiocoris tenuis]